MNMTHAQIPLFRACSVNPDTLTESADPTFEFDYIDIGSVSLEGGVGTTERLRFADAPSRARRVVQANDIIISAVRTYLRAVAIIEDHDGALIASTGFAVLRANRDVNARYLLRVVQSEPFLAEVVRRSTGVSYPAINASALARIPIPMPSQASQDAIAAYLDREITNIDRLIELKGRLSTLSLTRHRMLQQHLVSGGTTTPSRSSADWLSYMPHHWTAPRLCDCVSVRGGATPSKERPEFWQGDIPWVSAKDMKRDFIDSSEDSISDEAIASCSVSKIDPGAILIVTRGMILARTIPVAETVATATINQDLKALLPKKNVSAPYLRHMLQGFESVLLSHVEEAAHGTKKLRSDRLFKARFPLPPLEEQEAIVSRLEESRQETDRLIEANNLSIARLRERRMALITGAVNGQISPGGNTGATPNQEMAA